MATKDEMNSLREQIVSLEQSRFARDGESVRPVRQGESLEHAFFWSELLPEHKLAVMEASLDWPGFEPAAQLEVMENVLAGKDAAHWMDGIEPGNPTLREMLRPLSDQGYRGFRDEFLHELGLIAAYPDEASREVTKPRNHGTYQVWRGGDHVFDVESVAVHKVHELTDRAGWEDVASFYGDDRRPLQLGDVVVDPTCGAWEIQEEGYLAVQPPAAVKEQMERDGIVPQYLELLRGWTADMLQAPQAAPDHDTHQLGALAHRQPANDNHELER